MYKDSIHEGFFWPRYFRSPIVGLVMGVIAYAIARPGLDSAASIVSFFGAVYVLERGAVELWKTFLRNEDQSKYFIPMQFAVFGNVVQSQSRRLHHRRDHHGGRLRHFSRRALRRTAAASCRTTPGRCSRIATISGWISAFLGAWKDAPVEGFQPLKFVRSPLWSGFWGLLLAHFNFSILVVMMAGLGFTIFTLETYKTFFFPVETARQVRRQADSRFPTCFAGASRSSRSMRRSGCLVLAGFWLALTGPRRASCRSSEPYGETAFSPAGRPQSLSTASRSRPGAWRSSGRGCCGSLLPDRDRSSAISCTRFRRTC